jgi:putative ABC transport system permease protein
MPFRLLHYFFRRQQSEAEMAEEMRYHLEQRAADYTADGLPTEEARYAAQRKFGNLGSIQEHAREARGWGWLDRGFKDVRLAFRQLIKSPGFTLLAVITLGLGVGANTSMFSVLNSLLLRPLPYPHSEQLERIDRVTPQNSEGRVSPADFFEFRQAAGDLGEVAANALGDLTLSEPGQPADVAPVLRITSNYFSVLGVHPELGRNFRPEEDIPGNDHVLMISQRCWQNRFGRRADIVGHKVRVDGMTYMIVGVLPATANDWRYLGWVDLFRPIGLEPQKAADRRTPLLRMIVRRSGKLSRAEASTVATQFGARLAAEHPEVNADSSWRMISLNRAVAGKGAPMMLTMLIGLSSFVLLIACSNLANLLLARTMARAREFAVRAALGASRLQLLRPLIAESLVLAIAGGACAIVVAMWTSDWLAVRSMDDSGQGIVLPLDWHVLGWAFAASLATAVAFGLAPGLFALRLDVNDTLKSGGRGMTGGPGHQRFRNLLIIGQFGLAMVLLAGAALFVSGLNELNGRRSGWSSDQLVSGTIVLPAGAYPDADKIAAFQRLTIERLESLPGVAAASVSSFTPFFEWGDVRKYRVEGREISQPGHEPVANVNSVSPRYFETVGTRIVSGRAFNASDSAAAPKVFIINQAMAAGLFGNENPIGRHLARAGTAGAEWGEIVGVAVDATPVLTDPGPVTFQIYQPMAQEPRAQNEIIVRAANVAPTALIGRIRTLMARLDADLPVRQLQPADTTIYRTNYQLRVLRDILFFFASLGLGLASLGVYGVIARTTAQRANEFAIRLALGACVRDITQLVLKSGVRLAVIGSAIGLFGAIGVSRLLTAGFPAMHLSNPFVLLGTALFLIGVALLASWIPARRAGKVDAVLALRAE